MFKQYSKIYFFINVTKKSKNAGLCIFSKILKFFIVSFYWKNLQFWVGLLYQTVKLRKTGFEKD